MSGYDPATLAFYESEAPVYAASGSGGVARHIPDFLVRLTPGSKILELGCGGGIDAAYMIAQGHHVTATDGCSAIAAQAESRLGQPVKVMRFDELDSEAKYDAVVASASLLHVPRNELSAVLQRIWTALKPGGWHVATYKSGGLEGRDHFGRYFNYPDCEQLHAFYQIAARWDNIEIVEGVGGGYDGKQGPWLRFIGSRPK